MNERRSLNKKNTPATDSSLSGIKKHKEQKIQISRKLVKENEPESKSTNTMPAEPATELPPPAMRENSNFVAPDIYQHPLQISNSLTFMLGEDAKGPYLYAEGVVTEGAFFKFQRYVNYFKRQGVQLNRFMMHSPGGLLKEGISIGKYINTHQWSTDLDQHMRCYSSCALIYAAGTTHYLQTGAQLGFHRPYLDGVVDTPALIEQLYQDLLPYWQRIDGDPALYDHFMRHYGRNEMMILTTENINNYMEAEQY